MFAEAEKQNEEIKCLKRENERERGGMNCLQEMAQTVCLKKQKEKLFEKDVDRGLELLETLRIENGQG